MGAANCNNAIAGMYRAMATPVTVLSLVVVLAHAQKDATPEVLLSQLPDGFSYQDTDDVTNPDYDAANLRGQDGLSAKLKAAHADEAKERRKADGLQGEMVLSSVVSKVVQGLPMIRPRTTSMTLSSCKFRILKTGLPQAGLARDTYHEDDPTVIDLELVQDWHPKGQNLGGSEKAKARKEEKRELEGKADFMPPVKKDQAYDKEDLFGMVDIDVKLKADHPDDELQKLGIIDTKKIHFRDGKKKEEKGWLSEDDIQLVQTQH